MNVRERLSRLLPRTDEPRKSVEPPEAILRGVYKDHGRLMLVAPQFPRRGLKLVDVPDEMFNRYIEVERDYQRMQRDISELPTSLRPRRVRQKEEE